MARDGEFMELDIDEILPYVGEFGRFQKVLCFIMLLVIFPVSFQPVFTYFATIVPPWQCVHNSATCLLNGTFLGDDIRRCDMQRHDWIYTEDKNFSIVTQFDLECNQKWILYLITSIFFVGWAIGAMLIGGMADSYGRRTFIMPSVVVILVTGLASPFMPTIYLVVFCRFVIGFAYPGVFVQVSILLAEIVGNKYRPLVTNVPPLAYAFSGMILGLKAYLLKNWKLLSIACTAPYVFVLAFYALIPESVRWLQLKNRSDEAISILLRIARWNKKKLPANIRLSSHNSINRVKPKLCDMFRTHTLALQSFVQMYIWMVIAVLCYGLQLASNVLEGSVYRDFVLLSIVDIPAALLSVIACQTIGRKKAALLPLLIGGAACLAIAWIPNDGNSKMTRIVLGIAGKLAGSSTFHTIYIWSAEIFPTNIRGVAMGVLQVSARVGSASSTWVMQGLGAFGGWIPFTVVGISSLIGSGLGMWLPETKEVVLKESLDVDQKGIYRRMPKLPQAEENEESYGYG